MCIPKGYVAGKPRSPIPYQQKQEARTVETLWRYVKDHDIAVGSALSGLRQWPFLCFDVSIVWSAAVNTGTQSGATQCKPSRLPLSFVSSQNAILEL